MSDSPGGRKHPLVTFDTAITGVRYDGVLLPLEPYLVRLLVRLMKAGSLHSKQINENPKTASVYVSFLREVLRDTGFPFEIQTIWGEQSYTIVPEGQPVPGVQRVRRRK